jgi:predicted amidohydrolase
MMRIAAFQRYAIVDDFELLCAHLTRDLNRAIGAGVDLALFPECHLLGHSYDGDVISRRARQISDGLLQALCGRLPPRGPMIVIGGFELQGANILNSAIVITDGAVIGRYAKAHPNEPGVTAGTEFPIFEQSGCRFGINVCNDANHPDAAQSVANQRADLILYPLNNMLPAPIADQWRARSIANLQARALQTGCWIASADVTGLLGDRISHGCTAIVTPAGEIAARVAEGAEGIAIADIPIGSPVMNLAQ